MSPAALLAAARARLEANDLAGALQHAERALASLAHEHAEPAAHIEALCLLGAIHTEAGRYAEAEAPLRRARALADRAAPRPDAQAVRVGVRVRLADVLRLRGAYNEARELLEGTLAFATRRFGRGSAELAPVWNALGVVCKYTGQYARGLRAYRAALDAVGSGEAADEGFVATVYHNLGGLEHARGKYLFAEPFARRAVELRRRALGDAHPMVARDEAAHAAVLAALGRHDEAEAVYRRVLAFEERHYGPDYYEVAVNLDNLADIESDRGEHEKAIGHYRRALAIREKSLGPDHPQLGMTLNDLGVALEALGRFDEARGHMQRAVALFASLGADHPKLKTARANLARLDDARAESARAPAASKAVKRAGTKGAKRAARPRRR